MSRFFYGDQNRWFVGLVIDVNDPLKLDRVRVRIQGIHTHDTSLIPNSDFCIDDSINCVLALSQT